MLVTFKYLPTGCKVLMDTNLHSMNDLRAALQVENSELGYGADLFAADKSCLFKGYRYMHISFDQLNEEGWYEYGNCVR